MGLDYLLNISFVDDDEVFKICLDFWNYFVPDVYASVTTGMADANAAFAFGGVPAATSGRRQLYAAVLSRLRLLMISRMAKPEEVLSCENSTFRWRNVCMSDATVYGQQEG